VATAAMALGEVQIAAREGHSVPPGTGLDANGKATTDPNEIVKGMLLPFGGYKGSAIALMVELLSAGAVGKTGIEGPEFDHLCLRVDLQEPWLADVGFGDCFLEPLRLRAGIEQADPAGTFRIVQRDERFQLEKVAPEAGWKKQYSFSLQPRRLEEFAGMCDYHQTSPESPFTQKSVCSRATMDGRVTVADMKLIVTRNGVKTETSLTSEGERDEALQKHFGIRLAGQ